MAYEERIEMALPTPAKILTPGVVTLLSLMVVGYALLSYAPEFTLGALLLHPTGVLGGQVWQIITYSFINSGCALAWNGLIVLFMGSALEREWRTKSFLALCATCCIVCGVVWIAASLILGLFNYPVPAGMSSDALVYGIVGAFGVTFRRKRFFVIFWTMEGHHLAILMVAIGVIIRIPAPIFWIWVAGALVGWMYVVLVWKKAEVFNRLTPAKSKSRFEDL